MYQKSNEREEKMYAPQQIVQVHTMQNQRLSAQKQFEYVNVCVLLAKCERKRYGDEKNGAKTEIWREIQLLY